MTRSTLYRIHVWLSIPLGIIITLICLSGATLVFKNEIRDALGMPRVVAQHSIQRTGRPDGGTVADAHGSHHRHANANADAHGTTRKRDFFSYVTRFHTSLYMGKTGKMIVTYTTVFFILILVSGVWICWPRNRKQWRQRLSIAGNKGRFRLFYDLHVSLGFYALIWLLALAVTGAAIGMHLVPKGSAAMTLFHEIHVGKWGGLVTKAITFAVSIIGASLPLTGYYLYFKKHFRKNA